MAETFVTDIFVAGNGPAGKIAALAIADAGFSVVIAGPEQSKPDHRTTALMLPSIRLLESLGVWANLKDKAAPLRVMRIVDGTSRLVRSRPVTFRSTEIDEDAFGYNLPNIALNEAIADTLKNYKNVRQIIQPVVGYEISEDSVSATLADNTRIKTRLVVAADGRDSLAREHSGIKNSTWSYPQSAFVTTFSHRFPHEDMSTEFHTETGPFTQVPLPGNRSSLVWVVKPDHADRLKTLDDAALSHEIEERMQSILGRVAVGTERQIYPLSGQYPLRFGQNRIALVGEAAHVFPPIGAQGLNLGLRDVEDLCKAVMGNPVDPGSDQVLKRYDAARRPDILARTGAVDALNRTLLSSFLPTQMLRATGLAMLDIAPPLRGLFMREGMRPGSGIGAVLGSIREKIRRKSALGNEVQEP